MGVLYLFVKSQHFFFNVNRKWFIHFEPNTMQTTLFTKSHSTANWVSRNSVPPQGHTTCMSCIYTALVHNCPL